MGKSSPGLAWSMMAPTTIQQSYGQRARSKKEDAPDDGRSHDAYVQIRGHHARVS